MASSSKELYYIYQNPILETIINPKVRHSVQTPVTGPSPDPHESSLQPHTLLSIYYCGPFQGAFLHFKNRLWNMDRESLRGEMFVYEISNRLSLYCRETLLFLSF
jgi:hypothetical protein